MRAGTHAMHNIVGFAKACELAKERMSCNIKGYIESEILFKKEILKIRSDVTFNGDQEQKIPGLLSINIPGINNELFCKEVSDRIAFSTGSACSIGEKSYVLEALKIKNPMNTIRISLPCKTDNIIDVIRILEEYL